MLENMIVKLQTLTGGLRGGKSLHHFVFNGPDLIVKHCLPLLFRKEPIYRGRWKGHRAAGLEHQRMALAFHSNSLALRSHSSLLCPRASQTLPGTPPASRGELAQPRLCMGPSPGAAHTPCQDGQMAHGLQLGHELLAACFSWAQLSDQQRGGQQARTAQARQRGHWWHLLSHNFPFGGAVFVMAGSTLCPRQGCTHSLAVHPHCWQLCGTMGKMSSTVSC